MLRFRSLLFFGWLSLLGVIVPPAHCATPAEKTETKKKRSPKTSPRKDKKNRRKASPPVETPGAWQAPLYWRETIGVGVVLVLGGGWAYERNALQKEVATHKGVIVKKEGTVKELQKKMNLIKTEVNTLEQENEILKKNPEVKDKLLIKLNQENGLLQQKTSQQTQQINNLLRENKSLKGRPNSLQQRYLQLQQENKNLKKWIRQDLVKANRGDLQQEMAYKNIWFTFWGNPVISGMYKPSFSAAAFMAYLRKHPKTDLDKHEEVTQARQKINCGNVDKDELKGEDIGAMLAYWKVLDHKEDLRAYPTKVKLQEALTAQGSYPQLWYMTRDDIHSTFFMPAADILYLVTEEDGGNCNLLKFSSLKDFLDVLEEDQEGLGLQALPIPFLKGKK